MPATIDYSGKIALITGGNRGIGLAIVKEMATAGANIALTYGSTPKSEVDALLQDLQSEFPDRQFKAFQLNGSESKSYQALLPAILQSGLEGSLDIVVANAGIALWKEAENMTDDEMLNIFGVNTFGPYYLMRECVNTWLPAGEEKTKGSLEGKVGLVVSSVSGHVAMSPQKQAAYNASKAAVTAFSKSLAIEWAPLGFRINCISPGYVATDMLATVDKTWVDEWVYRTPLGRMATAQDIGKSVVAMCSDNFMFMTGSDVLVDGGYACL
ncbi:Reductases with broad range of substrate specificities [Phaffia rhodozyma]|uniref:Reductases with broad range of substrate specificities n=1 Tax=Phaffia rhodozyma TaxID=264483 RepID=A0A0F7SLP9_PHARH|nr:Reductases with broad range of substrate specificities [Phaffia rhodozyma]